MHGYTKKSDCTIPPPYHAESRALKRPVPAASRHSTVNSPSTHTGPRDLLQGRHGHRLEEGALGYSNMKTYRRLQMLTSFLPRFLPGATTQERTSVLMVTPPTVTWSPVQPRSLDLCPARGGAPPKSSPGRGFACATQNSRPLGCRHGRTIDPRLDFPAQEVKQYKEKPTRLIIRLLLIQFSFHRIHLS